MVAILAPLVARITIGSVLHDIVMQEEIDMAANALVQT